MRRAFVVALLLLLAVSAAAQMEQSPAQSLTSTSATAQPVPEKSAPPPPVPEKTAPTPNPAPAQNLVATPPAPKTAPVMAPTNAVIPKGARIYIAPIPGGYDIYLTAAIQKKQVPVTVVVDRTKADFEIAGVTETQNAGWAKMLFLGNDSSNEQASIAISNIKTGEIVFGYNVNKRGSARGKQSSSEACAKHLKEKIEGGN